MGWVDFPDTGGVKWHGFGDVVGIMEPVISKTEVGVTLVLESQSIQERRQNEG